MEIVSVSLDSENVTKISEIMKTLGIKSRSRLMRASLDSLIKEYEVLSELQGMQTVVFMISQKKKSDISELMHKFQNLIKTNIHHHSHRGCLDILITEGDAASIRKLYLTIKNSRNISSVSVSVV